VYGPLIKKKKITIDMQRKNSARLPMSQRRGKRLGRIVGRVQESAADAKEAERVAVEARSWIMRGKKG
jgi:uncharacterized protein (DUF2384 family)